MLETLSSKLIWGNSRLTEEVKNLTVLNSNKLSYYAKKIYAGFE